MSIEILIAGTAVLISGGLFFVIGKAIFSGRESVPPHIPSKQRRPDRASTHKGGRPKVNTFEKPANRRDEVRDTRTDRYKDGPNNRDDEDFFVSAAVTAATDSPILGYAVGGSIAGAIIGDMLSDDSHTQDSHEEISRNAYDDSHSSYDDNSSSDSYGSDSGSSD